MALSNVHIQPVAPDANASGRYGSSDERAHREHHARRESQDTPASDRLEISRSARETYRASFFGPDMDFARKALEKAPPLPESRLAQVIARLESGYYRLPSVIWSVVTRMFPSMN